GVLGVGGGLPLITRKGPERAVPERGARPADHHDDLPPLEQRKRGARLARARARRRARVRDLASRHRAAWRDLPRRHGAGVVWLDLSATPDDRHESLRLHVLPARWAARLARDRGRD